MRVTYDPKYNIAYIMIGSKAGKGLETIKLSDDVAVDVTPDGKIHGLELLNAKAQLHLIKGAQFTFTNAGTGESVRLPLGV